MKINTWIKVFINWKRPHLWWWTLFKELTIYKIFRCGSDGIYQTLKQLYFFYL